MTISFLMTVDPAAGKRSAIGVAQFVDGRLNTVATVAAGGSFQIGGSDVLRCFPLIPDVLVCEWPQVYRRGQGRTLGDPNHLLPLAGLVGYLCCAYAGAEVRLVRPAEWGGQMKKPAVRARVLDRLDPGELDRVPRHLTHDGYDAIAIGLYALGRFEPRRVYRGAS